MLGIGSDEVPGGNAGGNRRAEIETLGDMILAALSTEEVERLVSRLKG